MYNEPMANMAKKRMLSMAMLVNEQEKAQIEALLDGRSFSSLARRAVAKEMGIELPAQRPGPKRNEDPDGE